jgi:cytidine deaminase
VDVDWDALRAEARRVMAYSYSPYSNFAVGAAALVDDGRIVSGCNVENASYGVVLCAECGLVSTLHATGGGRLIAFACVDAAGDALMPCGRCRQLLFEHGGSSLLIDHADGIMTLDSLLPHAFGPHSLTERS